MIPSTVDRVPQNTAEHVNQGIRCHTEDRVSRCAAAGQKAIDRRLAELNNEWDIELTLNANAAAASLVGLTLVRRWIESGSLSRRGRFPATARRPRLVSIAAGVSSLGYTHAVRDRLRAPCPYVASG